MHQLIMQSMNHGTDIKHSINLTSLMIDEAMTDRDRDNEHINQSINQSMCHA